MYRPGAPEKKSGDVENSESDPTPPWNTNRAPFDSRGTRVMKYILMMHGKKADWDAYVNWPKEDLLANMAFMRAFTQELEEAGVFVATHGLASPDQAKVVRAGSDGEPVTDGVFPEAKEFLAG